jgi:hypothetical protein
MDVVRIGRIPVTLLRHQHDAPARTVPHLSTERSGPVLSTPGRGTAGTGTSSVAG